MYLENKNLIICSYFYNLFKCTLNLSNTRTQKYVIFHEYADSDTTRVESALRHFGWTRAPQTRVLAKRQPPGATDERFI